MGFKIYYFMVSPSRNPPHSCPTSTTMASGRPPSLDHLCNVHGMYCTFASPNSGPQIDMYLNKNAKMVLTGELKTRLKPDQLFACPISPPSKKTRATHAASVGFSSSAPSTARSNLEKTVDLVAGKMNCCTMKENHGSFFYLQLHKGVVEEAPFDLKKGKRKRNFFF
eukprot:TRINITY_DN19862_c0_g1_i2.p1 TRINITY_DN19862_c0_g1~~TRINITY_DN19862_c0_g1_i2.p1  ORF type:complete len:167 (-),score=27.02 TRINITY_DN19862_c0_g1_i2:743-1243(-)